MCDVEGNDDATVQLCNGDKRTGEMEELQIALLECATEYEIKVGCVYSRILMLQYLKKRED